MTQHPLTHVTSAVVVGVLMSAGAVGAQTSQQRLMLHDVAPPSSDFTTYLEGALIRVSIPSN